MMYSAALCKYYSFGESVEFLWEHTCTCTCTFTCMCLYNVLCRVVPEVLKILYMGPAFFNLHVHVTFFFCAHTGNCVHLYTLYRCMYMYMYM